MVGDLLLSFTKDIWHYGVAKRDLVPFDFEKDLEKLRRRYARRPYRAKNLPRPAWMDHDPLNCIYREQAEVFAQGSICYGCIVQANAQLFHFAPRQDAPANLIYSDDPFVSANPVLLQKIAAELFSYKGWPEEQVPEGLREIVRAVRDERNRTPLAAGTFYCAGRSFSVRFVSVMVFRRHLPYRQLLGPLVPVIALPRCPGTVLILPKAYWSREFIARFWDDSYDASCAALQKTEKQIDRFIERQGGLI